MEVQLGRHVLYPGLELKGDDFEAVAVILLPQGRKDVKVEPIEGKQN